MKTWPFPLPVTAIVGPVEKPASEKFVGEKDQNNTTFYAEVGESMEFS